MILNEFYLTDYLMEKGFLSLESLILDNTLVIKNHSQRTNCYSIESKAVSLFLKQQHINVDYKNQSFLHEAELYNSVLQEKKFSPSLIFFDKDHDILCLEYFRKGQNLYDYIRSKKEYPESIIQSLAEKISALHHIPPPSTDKTIPWILPLHSKTAFRYIPRTAAAREIIDFIRSNVSFCAEIETLNGLFTYNAFVHNDLKTNNILFADPSSSSEVYLIDWEFARMGDRLFDLGTLLSSWLFFWAGVNVSLDKMDSFAFFKALFLRYREINQLADPDFFLLITKYAGLRTIQFCLEATIEERNSFASFKRMIQLSLNLLHNDNLLVQYFTSND